MGGHSWGYLEEIEGFWQETWMTGSSKMSWMTLFDPKKIPWKFCIDIFIRSVSKNGLLHRGTWGTLGVPDRRLGGQGHIGCHECTWQTPMIMSWKFRVIIFIFGWNMRVSYHGKKMWQTDNHTNTHTLLILVWDKNAPLTLFFQFSVHIITFEMYELVMIDSLGVIKVCIKVDIAYVKFLIFVS